MDKLKLSIALMFVFFLSISAVAATCNIIVITDPTGQDPNGADGQEKYKHQSN